MNILILTSISPVLAGDAYRRITNELTIPDYVGFLCYPFFAEIKCMQEDKAFLPVFFAMLKQTEKPEMNKKLFDKKINVVIGNSYKSQDFDIIVAIDDVVRKSETDEEDVAFDSYIGIIEQEEELKDFGASVNIGNLYKLEDAEIIFPTVKHAILFLEGVVKNADSTK